jgi:hypothetical protein
MRLMEWCYMVCCHERLRGRHPAKTSIPAAEPIVITVNQALEQPATA